MRVNDAAQHQVVLRNYERRARLGVSSGLLRLSLDDTALSGPEAPAAQMVGSAMDSPYCIGEPAPDLDLACLMQITVILDSYTQYFVKPVVEAYNLTIGLGFFLVAQILFLVTFTRDFNLPTSRIPGAIFLIA